MIVCFVVYFFLLHVKADSYPYQVSIRHNGIHKCCGSLLNNRWILTAAHCTVKYNPTTMTIVLGTNNIYSNGVAARVEQLIPHPRYVYGLHYDDIGLIKLDKGIKFSNNIMPVDLPLRNVECDNCTAVFTGWGVLPRNDGSILKSIVLKMISVSECRKVFPDVTENNICTLNFIGQGICYGDSGGPLVQNKTQIGIGSWGSPCANGYPDVHTRVYKYIDWIKENIAT